MLVSYWTKPPLFTQLRTVKLFWSILAISLLPFPLLSIEDGFWGYEDAKEAYNGILWKSPLKDFSAATYRHQVDQMLETFEKTVGKTLKPGSTGRVALKVYTNSGVGLATPKNLTNAVIACLLERGFTRESLCIVDARTALLRDAGYLPPLSRMEDMGPYYDGIRVYALDEESIQSTAWYYESPLPREYTSPLGRIMLHNPVEENAEEARKSYLPVNLINEVDFWINLPVACHHPATGLSGALVNASLWNISNGTRFFHSPANAPIAVAEISSIPEIKDRWALNLISLEGYQYIAGPAFNANYTDSLPELWMSSDPVIMDANLILLMNKARIDAGFYPFPILPEFIEYSVQLGLGKGLYIETQTIQVR